MFADIKPHLAELRKRLSLAVLSVVVAFVVAFTFHNIILTWITAPLNKALTEVGRIVNAQGKTTWEIQSTDANGTKVEVVTPKSAQ